MTLLAQWNFYLQKILISQLIAQQAIQISQNDQKENNIAWHFCTSKGKDTQLNISFRLFYETQFNVYFITFNLISGNSYKIYKKEFSTNYDRKKMNSKENEVFSLVLIKHIFSKKTTKQNMKRKRSVWVKAWLKNCMYKTAFNFRSR